MKNGIKSCNKCKALNRDNTCKLGYEASKRIPLEDCPKPTTYLALKDLKE